LYRVIDCRSVTERTTSYEDTQIALELARTRSREGAIYTRRARAVRERGTSSSS